MNLLQWMVAMPLFLVGLLGASGQDAMEEGCVGDCEPASLLQTKQTADKDDEPMILGAWVVGFWGKCMTSCGQRKFRDFTCRSIVDAAQLPTTACKGSKPTISKVCNCEKEECDETPTDDCPEDTQERHAIGTYETIGCLPKSVTFSFPWQDKKGPQRDLSCAGWNKTEPCHGGLPFYGWRQYPMEPDKCKEFCASRGMDLSAIEGSKNTNRCRCGASILSTSIWNGEIPKAGLAVDFSTVTHDKEWCNLKLFRYTGYYTPNGLPNFLWTHAGDKEDITYVDTVKRKHGSHKSFWPGHPDGDFTID